MAWVSFGVKPFSKSMMSFIINTWRITWNKYLFHKSVIIWENEVDINFCRVLNDFMNNIDNGDKIKKDNL